MATTAFGCALGVKSANKASVLEDGRESRSRQGNQNGSIIDGDPSSVVVTYDGSTAKQDWFAVTLAAPAR